MLKHAWSTSAKYNLLDVLIMTHGDVKRTTQVQPLQPACATLGPGRRVSRPLAKPCLRRKSGRADAHMHEFKRIRRCAGGMSGPAAGRKGR